MKILLINPPTENIINLELPLFVRQNEGHFPPLGIMYVASYLKKFPGYQIRVLDALAEKMDYAAIEEYVQRFCPDIVGIAVHTHSLIDAISVSRLIKKADNRTHICFGGPHADIFPRETIDIPSVDSVVFGEGELTFAELVDAIRTNADLRQVRGIFFKQDGQVVQTQERGHIEDLDGIPFPDRGMTDKNKYSSILGKNKTMTTIVSSRGCPYSCAFCSTPKGSYRVRSPKGVVDEMEECVSLGINEIHFVDDTFNADSDRVAQICFELDRRRLKARWSFRGRIDKLNEPLLKKMKRSGCFRIHLGVETSSDEGLERLNKGVTTEQIRQVFKLTRSVKISTVAYFLIGCPHEDSIGEITKTINFSRELDPDFALFNILTPYPKTQLYAEALKRGVLERDYWLEYVQSPKNDFRPPFWKEHLSSRELVSLLYLAYRKFYLRPRFILRAICTEGDLGILARRIKTGLEIMQSL